MAARSQVAILFWIKEHLKYLYQQEVVFFSDIVTYEATSYCQTEASLKIHYRTLKKRGKHLPSSLSHT